MIRQAISCDVCGAEKQQTNHWFIAYEQGGELRVSGWTSRHRLRPDSKHLCGQTCLHKLVDDFMARALTARAPQSAQYDAGNELLEQDAAIDASLTSNAAYAEVESSARLIPTPAARVRTPKPVPAEPALPKPAAATRPVLQRPIELVALPVKPLIEELAIPTDDPPRFASRNWRAAAWERERERELRSGEHHAGMPVRRRFSS